MSDKQDKVAQLCAKLGFDPVKSPTGDAKVLASVIEEIQNERAVKVRGQLKELLGKAMEIRAAIDKAKKAFDKEIQKHEKELGKILSDVERLASGKDSAPEGEGDEAAVAAPADAKPAE